MDIKPIPRFKPLISHHCITGSLRHIYEFHHYPISEDLLLGVGAGVGFIYWHMKGIPPLFGGRANFERPGEKGLEKVVGERTGVQVESHYTSSRKKAETALLDLLCAGEPVMVYVDMGFLPYFDLPEDYHFGGHAVVVAGYDVDSGQTLLADRDGVLHPVALGALAQARGSTYKPFPPRHAWYTFDFSSKRPPTSEEVKQAIREVVTLMLHPPIANIGVKGIRTAAERILEWPTTMSDEALRQACWTVHLYIDAEGGTGGGIFRYMYARFLNEAAAITSDSRLAECGTLLHTVGDQWQESASLFTEAANATDPTHMLNEASKHLLAIADCEQAAWEQLQLLVG